MMMNSFSKSTCSQVIKYANYFKITRINIAHVNMFHSSNRLHRPRQIPGSKRPDKISNEAPLGVTGKYKVFEDADSAIIRNINEETETPTLEALDEYDEFQGLNTNRGLTGVYDIEELVEILRREKARDIFVSFVPPEAKYVDYICIVTGRNVKHMMAIAVFIRKLFKRKCNKNDIIPFLEGKTSEDWIALDLGNIVLHVFSEDARGFYDLETLWSIGSKFDPKCIMEKSHISNILERNEIFLHDLKPAKE